MLLAELRRIGPEGRRKVVEEWSPFLPSYVDPALSILSDQSHGGIAVPTPRPGAPVPTATAVVTDAGDEDEDDEDNFLGGSKNINKNTMLVNSHCLIFNIWLAYCSCMLLGITAFRCHVFTAKCRNVNLLLIMLWPFYSIKEPCFGGSFNTISPFNVFTIII